MNTKKDEPTKKETPGAAGPGSPRPHATLDLKATVVEPKGAKEAGKEPLKAAAQEPGKAAAAKEPGKDQKPGAPGASASSATARPGEPLKPGFAGPQPNVAAGKGLGGRPPPTGPASQASKPAGSSRFFTHLAAGIVGGIVALLAADMLASQLGLGGAADEQAEITAALQRRIEALESSNKGSTATLITRLKAAEGKLEQLGRVPGSIAKLEKGQNTLSGEVRALDAKVGAQGGDNSTTARVTKLEDKLNALSEAAAREPNGGGLPQLAAVTGKITDLESTVSNQLDALRKSVSDEIDERLAAATAASETAKSGTQRIDRELAGIKADNAQLTARLDALNAESQRSSQTLHANQEELTRLKVDLNAQLPNFARPQDITAATTPLADKIAGLQKDVQNVVSGEAERKQTARRIVLSLELANLKRAIDRGTGYAAELAAARKLSDGSVDLAPLARFADTGVPTLANLRQEFKSVSFKIIDAGQQPADGSIMERLLAGAKSVVRVRKISHESDDKSVDAIVARMETALNEDRLDDVIQQAKTLPPAAQDAASDFITKVEARNSVDRALTSVESQLKASLVAPPAAAAPSGQ